ncbi:hypothetical protein J6590_004592 [Homalodisca vitripennis]|nr:hypothetical protein J6590_004592 [Homalodisca vitripennis]
MFPFKYVSNRDCKLNEKCEDNCSGRGTCESNEAIVPSCSCKSPYHDVTCNKRYDGDEKDIVFAVQYTFRGEMNVNRVSYITVETFTRNLHPTLREKHYVTAEIGDYWFYKAEYGIRHIGQNSSIKYTIPLRFHYIPYYKSKDVFVYENNVLGRIEKFKITVRTRDYKFYQNEFTGFVPYKHDNRTLCAPIFRLKNCGGSPEHPVTYHRSTNIVILNYVTQVMDGSYVTHTVWANSVCEKYGANWWYIRKFPTGFYDDNLYDEYGELIPPIDVAFKKTLNIQPFTLELGKYRIVYNFGLGIRPIYYRVTDSRCYFDVKGLPLVAIIDGGSERTIRKQHGINLIARRSHDPNMHPESQSHVYIVWKCENLIIKTPKDEFCLPKRMRPSDEYYIPAISLSYGAIYLFTLEVHADMYLNCKDCSEVTTPKLAQVKINVKNETDDLYGIIFSCIKNCREKVLTNNVMLLKVRLEGFTKQDNVFVWLYNKFGEPEQPVDAIAENGLPHTMLIVKENSLTPGTKYTIKYEITANDKKYFFNTYVIETEKNDYHGSCSVVPESGKTEFHINCTHDSLSTFIYEFYDKDSDEAAAKDVMFSGRMLGTSYDGELENVMLSRGNVFVYILNYHGLAVSKTIAVKLSDWNINDTLLEERYLYIEEEIVSGNIPSALQMISVIPDILLPDSSKNIVFRKLLHYITQVHIETLPLVKLSISTLYNVLMNLNKDIQLTVDLDMMVDVVAFLKHQAFIFKNNLLRRESSLWMSPSDARQLSSCILTCLDVILMCRDPNLQNKQTDDYNLLILNQFKRISVHSENVIQFISEGLSYLHVQGQSPTKVSSVNNSFILWVIKNDDDYPLHVQLQKHVNIPVNISNNLYEKLHRQLAPTTKGDETNTNIKLQVVEISKNIFWWCTSDIRSNLVSVSLYHGETKGYYCLISELPWPIDIYAKLINTSNIITFNDTTVQPHSNVSELELDLSIKIHRIDCAPRSHTTFTFTLPTASDTLRVLIKKKFRPDYKMMMQYAVNISQQSPKYYLDNDDDDYKIFLMGVLPGLEVDVNQSITYSFQVTSVVCKFWRKNQWNSYGCTAKAHSEDDGIHCQCEHISTFAAAFSVPPLKVDHFADIDLFLTVQNNPLVLCIIIFLIVLYLLLGVLLWYLDRRDKKFTTVIVLDDNMPGNRYPYLLAVYTSSRLNAGTTAHVGLKLIGTLGSSHIHILTKENAKVLRRNSDDWFLLYCAEPLGLLDSIHIWHDNHGSSPEWYCDKIHVFDLKVGIETIFIVAQWMALSLKYYPEAMYNPTNEEELLGKRQILADNCFLGLREGHIFLAVLLRHPRNPISRVQRLTVLWCCIFSVMLCTLLYYLPEDRLLNTDEFQYTFGTRECYAILLSALVIIIVSNILLACFRRSNEYIHRRHDTLLYLRGGSRYGSRRPSTSSVTSQYSTHSYIQDSPSTLSMRSDVLRFTLDESRKLPPYQKIYKLVVRKLRTQPLLPVQLSPPVIQTKLKWNWFAIAWGLSIILFIISCYFCILYGSKLGMVDSKEWLSTFLASLLGEAFIFGPIKIALVAIILASACQRLYDLDTHTVDYKKARRVRIPNDEKYLIDLITKRQQPMYTPLSYEMRLTMFMKKVSRHNWCNLLDFITTACFVLAISLVISRLWVSYYDINSQVQKLLTVSHLPFMGAVDFFKITSVNEMENYLEYSLESALYNNRWYNDFEIVKEGTTNDSRGGHEMDRSYWTADLSNKVLGLPQLRQFRVIPIDCTLIGDGHDKCIPGLTEKYRDTATYEVGWKLASWSESERKNSPWIFTEDDYNSQFLLFRLYGESGKLYERGGYSVTLGPARSDADAVIVELREHKWQDKLTRVVVVELTLYNINLDVISQITLIVEHVETGNILLRAMVLTLEHYWKFNALTFSFNEISNTSRVTWLKNIELYFIPELMILKIKGIPLR